MSDYTRADIREAAAKSKYGWKLPEDNPELQKLVGKMIEHVTPETYFKAKNPEREVPKPAEI